MKQWFSLFVLLITGVGWIIWQEVSARRPLGPVVQLAVIAESGLRPDDIPAINQPRFESAAIADGHLSDEGWGIDVGVNGQRRFYPLPILVWHGVVNDSFAGEDLLITYDPLSGAAAVYERQVHGETTLFGVSGKLLDSNLLIFDRQTDSLWSQLIGLAIAGERTGDQLTLFPFNLTTWQEWKGRYPKGRVLSRETGAWRDYTNNPYAEYEQSSEVWFQLSRYDSRLNSKTRIYGLIQDDGSGVAYTEDRLSEAPAGSIFIPTFWFAWVAAFPDGQLIGS